MDRRIPIDEDGATPARAAWIPPVLLLAAVGLTVLLLRAGIHFFFLPIVLPFGLGGRRLLGRLSPSGGSRALDLVDGRMRLVARSVWGERVLGDLAIAGGVHVAIVPSGLWVAGAEHVTLRLVASRGALIVDVEGAERARRLRQAVGTLLEDAGESLLGADAVLAGAVRTRRVDRRDEVEWASGPRPGGGAGPVLVAFALMAALIVMWSVGASPGGWLVLGLLALTVVPFFWLSARGARSPDRVVLSLDSDGWTLRALDGERVAASTGGPGRPSAEVVAFTRADPTGMGASRRAAHLVLRDGGDVAATVGEELSEPELRFVASRVSGR